MFGRRRKKDGSNGEGSHPDASTGDFAAPAHDEQGYDEYDEYATGNTPDTGPYDLGEVDEQEATASRLDLGSVLVPLPPGGQIQVEMAANGTPQNVHLVTQHGRITVSAYAAPKSPGQWREVAAELAETLRNDNAAVSVESGPWGRELYGRTANADLRFIGVDGFRWMIRCVVAGPPDSAGADSELAALARSVVSRTVVRRGTDPHPVRTPLPVVLPEALVQQLAAAQQQQQLAARQAGQAAPAQGEAPVASRPQQPAPRPDAPLPPRRGGSGSAMQQLGF